MEEGGSVCVVLIVLYGVRSDCVVLIVLQSWSVYRNNDELSTDCGKKRRCNKLRTNC